MSAKYSDEIIRKAQKLHYNNVAFSEIKEQLKINSVQIIYRWQEKYEWDKFRPAENILLATSRKFLYYLELDNKTPQQLLEQECLSRCLENLERAESYKRGDDSRTISRNGKEAKSKHKAKKNEIDHLTQADFDAVADKILHTHQRIVYDAGKDPKTRRNRIILKPRQAGGTYGLAFEALESAVIEGQNQSFISATKRQAEVFKSYIAIIADKYFDCIVSNKLSNHAEFAYISPNSNAQSTSSNVYFDEIFWTANWKKMEALAAPMATHTKFKKTYISTPSTISHEAYEYWSGERFNAKRKESERVTIDINDMNALKKGRKDGDGFWRFAYTVHDVLKWGFNDEEGNCRINYDEIVLETDLLMFPCLFEAQFIDDSNSIFNLSEILACGVDTSKWEDFTPDATRPFSDKEVTAGYDPAGVGDNSSFVILSKPKSISEKFRLLVDYNWRGIPSPVQCDLVEKATNDFNVANLAIDNTGPGLFVGSFIEPLYPTVNLLHYSPELKTALVQKAKSVIQSKRFEYDENNTDLPLAFMTVHLKFTEGNKAITYQSTRNKRVGHGDLFWAIANAMLCEPVNLNVKRKSVDINTYN